MEKIKNYFTPDVDSYLTNEYFGSGGYVGKINIVSKKVYDIEAQVVGKIIE